MGRLFVYDENMTDERAKITVAKMAAVSDIVASEKAFIQYSAAGQLTVLAGAVIAVGDAVFQTEETTLSAANLDGAKQLCTRQRLLHLLMQQWQGQFKRGLFNL